MKKLTKQEKLDLYHKVDNEGFGYYMFSYGPDLKLMERMGYDKKELEAAIKLLSSVEEDIMSFEESADEEE